MPISIAGMHRSGTSMVARALKELGVNLGPECDLMNPAPDNPEGFFENTKFVQLNDKILHTLGGNWDRLPQIRDGWERCSDLDTLRNDATNLINSFQNQEPWGWKDPRNSLTLAFWRALIPDLKVVLCLRDPLEVAESLYKRNNKGPLCSLRLWLGHYKHLLATVPQRSRIVTHHQAYFPDPREELRRLRQWLKLQDDQDAMNRACASVKEYLRHQKTEGLLEAVGRLHADLRKEAGLLPS